MTVETMKTQRGADFTDRPRRERCDLVRDHKGQWWQTVIALRNGLVVSKVIPVGPRHVAKKAKLKLCR